MVPSPRDGRGRLRARFLEGVSDDGQVRYDATAGAFAFLDDIYDAQTGNKVAGLDLWDQGHISPIIVAADYSSIPEQTRVAVWSDDAAYNGSKGRTLADTEQNTDVTQAKINLL